MLLFRTRAARSTLISFAACAVLGYWYLCLNEFVADRETAGGDAAGVHRGVELDPQDAARHFWLGRYYLHVENDVEHAIAELQRATALNPGIGRVWLDLGLAQLAAGNTDAAKRSTEQALRAESHDLDTVLGAGHFYLVVGEPERAFALYHLAIDADPTMMPDVTDQVWRSSRDAQSILESVLPDRPEARASFFSYLLAAKDLTPSETVWRSMLAHHDMPERRLALNYVDELLRQNQAPRAFATWNELVELDSELRHAAEPGNMVYNPNFEFPLLGAGFDWQVRQSGCANWSLDPQQFHGGTKSMQAEINCQNISDLGLTQRILLQPGRQYILHAFIASKSLMSAGPPRLSLVDPSTRIEIAAGPDIGEQMPWSDYSFHFTAPDNASIAWIALWRSNPETRIKGTLWIDQVHLSEVSQ